MNSKLLGFVIYVKETFFLASEACKTTPKFLEKKATDLIVICRIEKSM